MFNIAQFTKFDPLPFIMAMAHQPCGVGNMPWKHALETCLGVAIAGAGAGVDQSRRPCVDLRST
jgi:hypothetical protein